MFKSQTRPVNIPQYEHGRLAGILAAAWGNDSFDRPRFDFEPFVAGVALHDWAYGLVDNHPLLETPEDTWLGLMRRGIKYHFDHPVTDIVATRHIRRLLGYGRETPERRALTDAAEEKIARRLAETDYAPEDVEWADRLTRFCDDVAFDFSFEMEQTREEQIFPRRDSRDEVVVTYTVAAGSITVDPWPFENGAFSGFITGYRREGYPERLQPLLVPYAVQPG